MRYKKTSRGEHSPACLDCCLLSFLGLCRRGGGRSGRIADIVDFLLELGHGFFRELDLDSLQHQIFLQLLDLVDQIFGVFDSTRTKTGGLVGAEVEGFGQVCFHVGDFRLQLGEQGRLAQLQESGGLLGAAKEGGVVGLTAAEGENE